MKERSRKKKEEAAKRDDKKEEATKAAFRTKRKSSTRSRGSSGSSNKSTSRGSPTTTLKDTVKAVAALKSTIADDDRDTHPYSVLKDKVERGKLGIQGGTCEEFLSNTEFSEVFKMSREEFKGLPKWKQKSQKRKVGLY